VSKSTQTQPWAPEHMLLLDIKAVGMDMVGLVPSGFEWDGGTFVFFDWFVDITQPMRVTGYVIHSAVNRYEQEDSVHLAPGDTYSVRYRLSAK
jgi:hypothetical protein